MRICIALALLASACMGTLTTGDDDGSDGSDGSAAPAAQPVQITVRDGAAPQAGVDVLFQASNGSVVAESATNAMGIATAMMTAGNVTVARQYASGSAEIYTYVGVAAGDRLVLGDPTDDTDTATPATINVTVPDGADGNVDIVSSCGTGQGTAPTVAMSVVGCPSSMVFYVTDADGDSFVQSAPQSTSVDLSSGFLEGPLDTTFSAQNITAEMASVAMEADAMTGTYELYTSGSQAVDAGPADVDLPDLHGVDELVLATITTTSGSTQLVATRKPYASVPHTFDAIANQLPYVSNATYAPNNLSWTETGNGSPQFIIATLTVTSSGGGAAFTRHIIAPHASSTLQVPVLAGADTIYNMNASDTFTGSVGLGNVTGGYATARQFAFTTPNLVDAAPMNATLVLSYAAP
ncbi:MAG TPA: hypothetical protein VH143_21715 [Kofleriaceae bacterium]|jgi:hypothetical protein|nr:hypothetical protein [Kofleriaceae bacterium]